MLFVGNRRGYLGNQSATGLLREKQLAGAGIEADVYQINQSDLSGRHQVRQWINQKALDGPLQMPGAVLIVDAFVQQHVLRRIRTLKNKLGPGGHHDAVLHALQLEIENLAQVMFLERTK